MVARAASSFPKRHRRFRVALGVSTLSLCLALVSPALAEQYDWSHRYGGSGSDRAQRVAVDGDHNVVVVGTFSGDASFGVGVLSTGGSDDVFVARYDRWGYYLWSYRYGGNANDGARAVAVDDAGNIFVVGYFRGSIDFGGGTMVSAGLDDIFVASFGPNGHYRWSRRFGGSNNDHAEDVTVDTAGNVAVTGYIRGAVDFGDGPVAGAGGTDGFVAVFNNDGDLRWSRGFGAAADDAGAGVAFDAPGNVVVTGSFQNTVDFGGGGLASAGLTDIFVVRYNAAGGEVWSRRYGDWNFQTGAAVAMGSGGTVIVVGSFFGTVDFGGGAFTSAGLWDGFVMALDNAGNHQWSRAFGSGYDDHAWDVAVTPAGDVVVSGEFGGTVDLGGGPIVSAGLSDAFAVVYNSDATYQWGRRYGDAGDDAGRGVAVDGANAVFFAGEFHDTIGVDTDSLESAGKNDIYLARYWTQAVSAVESPSPATADLHVYPNPFNPSTTVEYTVTRSGPVTIQVFDVAGRLVATLLESAPRTPGAYNERFRPSGLSSGVYFVRLQTPAGTVTRHITLLK